MPNLPWFSRAAKTLFPAGNAVAALGDSITAGGETPTTILSKNYLFWACFKSMGRLQYKGVYGTSGFTTAQILATHLPQVLAAKPATCVVLAGTNDVGATSTGGVTLASQGTFANLTSIYRQLQAAGITPVLCTVPPGNLSATPRAALTQLNNWITRYAQANRLPLANFHAALVDPATGNYAAGLTSDNVHPTNAGDEVMGGVLNTALGPLVNYCLPWLPGDNGESLNMVSNPLLLDSANGIPTGWTLANSNGTETPSVVADADFLGNAFEIAKTAGAGTSSYRMNGTAAVTAGDVVRLTHKLKITAWASPAFVSVYVVDQAFGIVGKQLKFEYAPGGGVLPVGVVSLDYTIPVGVTAVRLFAAISGGLATARIGQLGLTNLTAAGIS